MTPAAAEPVSAVTVAARRGRRRRLLNLAITNLPDKTDLFKKPGGGDATAGIFLEKGGAGGGAARATVAEACTRAKMNNEGRGRAAAAGAYQPRFPPINASTDFSFGQFLWMTLSSEFQPQISRN